MNQENELDKLFRDKLGKHGLPYSDAHWEQLTAMQDRKKKRRLLWIPAFALLISAGVGAVLYINKPAESEKAHAAAEKAAPLNDKTPDEHVQDDAETSGKNAVADMTTGARTNRSETRAVDVSMAQAEEELRAARPTENFPRMIPFEKAAESIMKVNEQFMLSAVKEMPKEEDNSGPRMLQPAPLIMFPVYDKFPDFGELSFVLHKFNSGSKPEKKQKVPAPWQFYAGASFDYNAYTRESMREHNKSEERTTGSKGFGVSLRAQKKRLYFKSGVSYMELLEKTNYLVDRFEERFDTSYVLVNANFTTSITGKRVALIRREINGYVIHTQVLEEPDAPVRFSYLRIPLLAGYEWQAGGLGFFAEGGVQAAVLAGSSGRYTEQKDGRFVTGMLGTEVKAAPLMWQASVAGGVRMPLSKRFTLNTQYGYAHGLTSMMRNYRQIAGTATFSLGLEVSLGK